MLTHEQILSAIPECLDQTDFPELGEKYEGKVRDVYVKNGRRTLITTDRISAFDRVLGLIPFKGQVLNQLSAWWFAQTADIVPNHLISMPDPNVTIAHEAQPLPVEIVVRGYITGVTKTSLWYLYEQGERRPYGISLPDGLQKNDQLPSPIITPTTKATDGGHDEQLTRHELSRGKVTGVSPQLWSEIERVALLLFGRGQAVARAAGLILVDTKYEMGLVNGRVTLIDEIHTPDSSRYWVADSYQPGAEPENFDKEFMRKWYAAQGYRGDGPPPAMPNDFIAQVAARYIAAYEKLTGEEFLPGERPVLERLRKNLDF
ncbi:MAG: phosphoribosylaminoimidazolesuccinocarboxamide synthase [Chloroflexi bacterium]|nr:phosphoribosylaminoimidazolesuccinocarboxamide synthase [Chloroflexota bacterium]MBP7045123.1 phosphoribosylaminoimidazolesuccinocarboxamide synthase [Chloroflexota bacterium]